MNSLLRWVGGIILGLLVFAAVLAVLTVVIANRRANTLYDVETAVVPVPVDAASIAEGQRLAAIRGCTECHGGDLGGRLFIDDPALGTFHAPNITPGGVVTDYTPAEWDLAVRHGLRPNKQPLFIMPSGDYALMSDEDLGRMIAYFQSLPASNAEWPEARVGIVGRALIATGQLPFAAQVIDPSQRPPARVEPAVSAAYGSYLAQTCTGCHGPDWAGGPVPGAGPDDKPAANLTPAGHLAGWSQDDFVRTMRTGATPDGRSLDPAQMPWPMTELMTDDELAALYLHFRSLPSTPGGGG